MRGFWLGSQRQTDRSARALRREACLRFIRGGSAVLVLLLPFFTNAQSTLSSSSYKLDNINFGSNFTLITGSSTTPPQISTEGPTVVELTPITAKISWKTDKKSSSTVQYGTTTEYGQETGSSTLTTDHTVTVFGLTAQTEYHFVVKSTDSLGASSSSSDHTFTTPAEAGINSIRVSDVGYDRALVRWTTGLFTASRLEYGQTISYGQTKSDASLSFLTNHTIQLTGLQPGSDYHFRIAAEDEKGNVSRSSDSIFTTIAQPSFVSINATSSTANEATVTWKTNVFTTGIVTYQSAKDEKSATAGDPTLGTDHGIVLKNLFGLTEYTFTIVATDGLGKQVKSTPHTFKTSSDTDPPIISSIKVNVTRSGSELVLNASWKTNEPSKSKVSYNPKTNAEAVTNLPESTTFSAEHSIITSGLTPSTPYTLTVIASDPFNNQAQQSINFVTPGLQKSILQLILDSILKPFGWVTRLFGG